MNGERGGSSEDGRGRWRRDDAARCARRQAAEQLLLPPWETSSSVALAFWLPRKHPNQPTNQSTNQPTNQSINQSINRINQSINQSINRINQFIRFQTLTININHTITAYELLLGLMIGLDWISYNHIDNHIDELMMNWV